MVALLEWISSSWLNMATFVWVIVLLHFFAVDPVCDAIRRRRDD